MKKVGWAPRRGRGPRRVAALPGAAGPQGRYREGEAGSAARGLVPAPNPKADVGCRPPRGCRQPWGKGFCALLPPPVPQPPRAPSSRLPTAAPPPRACRSAGGLLRVWRPLPLRAQRVRVLVRTPGSAGGRARGRAAPRAGRIPGLIRLGSCRVTNPPPAPCPPPAAGCTPRATARSCATTAPTASARSASSRTGGRCGVGPPAPPPYARRHPPPVAGGAPSRAGRPGLVALAPTRPAASLATHAHARAARLPRALPLPQPG